MPTKTTMLTVANLEIAVREAALAKNGWDVVNIKTFQANTADGLDANGVVVFDRTSFPELPDSIRYGTARWACECHDEEGREHGRIRFFSGNYDMSRMDAMIDYVGRKA